MAVKVVLSRTARLQLAVLLQSVALESPSGARRLEAAVTELLGRIGEYPESCAPFGTQGDRIGQAARRISLIYRVKDDRAHVVRAVYAGYDLRRLLDE